MQNKANEVCLSLEDFSVVTNLSETRLEIHQKLTRTNSIKPDHAILH